MKIISYKSFGLINFGMTEDQVIQQLGKPSSIKTSTDSIDYYYDYELAISFDTKKVVCEADIFPKKHGTLQVNDLLLNWQDNFYVDLCLADGDPYEDLGSLMLFNLGIAIRGYHDNDDAQKCIGVFNKGYWSNCDTKWTPLHISKIKTLEKRKLYLKNIFSYLEDLSVLAQIKGGVKADSLTSIETSAKIRIAREDISKLTVKKFKIEFAEISSSQFNNYIKNLHAINSKQIYVWTSQTEYCGSYKFDSLQTINFADGFYFGDIEDGIIPHQIWEFIPIDFKDRLILKLFIDASTGKETLEVKAQGTNWSQVNY